MKKDIITKEMFVQMVQTGAYFLAKEKESINKLNVFPVPDGDTGTNMNLTFSSGVKELDKVINEPLEMILSSFLNGLLMGARGNSGVILSQLFRGFSIIEKEEMTLQEFAHALDEGVKIAYQSVTNPVEGTILTVAKDMAREAIHAANSAADTIQFLKQIVTEGEASLRRTPDLLPILKEVGVVDSGGKGLLVIYEGFLAAVTGETAPSPTTDDLLTDVDVHAEDHVQSFIDPSSITYGYCTEFFVEFNDEKQMKQSFNESTFRDQLSSFGDSLLVAASEQMVKVHIHTETPGDVLNLAQQYGDLVNIDIENMRKQHEAIVNDPVQIEEERDVAIIAVAQGEGIKKLFQSMGVTNLIDGGQTMNPSTEQFIQAIDSIRAKHIFILPNNKNILLAANQAAKLVDKQVSVIPTISIPQGIKAMFEMDEELDIVENEKNIIASIAEVKTGLVTFATRDTKWEDLTIKKGEFIGLDEDSIKVAQSTPLLATTALLKQMIDDEEDEIVTIFSGEGVTEQEMNEIEQFIETHYPDLEIETYEGNQPIYSYIIMIE